jgi:transcriptional regulator with PAS, ATPase and Fis domain
LAHKGTIFLDEVGEIALDLQPRLLRVLEERQIWRVGDDKVIPVNIRIIAATNKNLSKMVMDGLFREDLYYRLAVLSFSLPPLRERKEDIITMIKYFSGFFTQSHNKNDISIAPDGMDILINYRWPGNVRELKNVVERLVITAQEPSIGKYEVLKVLGNDPVAREPVHESHERDNLLLLKERELISFVLSETDGNKTEAARKLGISRATLHRKLREMKKDL